MTNYLGGKRILTKNGILLLNFFIFLHYHLVMILVKILDENKYEDKKRKKKFMQMAFEIV